MAKKVIKDSSWFLEDDTCTFFFLDEWYKKTANFFLEKGSDFLFALSVYYPGLYEIDMAYLDKAKQELKNIGFKVETSSNRYKGGPRYRIFYLGPRVYSTLSKACSTRKEDARAFRIFIYALGE